MTNTIDKDFVRRIEEACDLAPHVPEKNFGRLRWIVDQMAQHNEKVSYQSVQKWMTGASRPRGNRLNTLAKVLRVDPAWLAFGNNPVASRKSETRSRNVEAAPNYVAGMLALSNINFGWESGSEEIHFRAIIDGRSIPIFATVGEESGGKYEFDLPARYEGNINLVLVRRSPMTYDLYRIPDDMVSKSGRLRGGYVELKVSDEGDHLSAAGNRAPRVNDPKELG